MTVVASDVALRQLTTTVELSHLLREEHLAEFVEWQKAHPESTATEGALWLVDQGLTTRWQAQQLLSGNHSFFLKHYKLVNRLGGGGMGTVFQAIDDQSGRLVAVKVIRKSAMQRPNALERFKREIAALGKLRHPNIVAAYEAGQLGQYHYLVMEYIEGRDIGYWVAKLKKLPIDMACEVARQAALGLDHAHKLGFIHRDIKPSNLIAVRKPDGMLDVRILDFGLARSYEASSEEARVTRAGQIVGTVDYLAPEQAQGAKTVDGRADVYSLGVTLFEMVAGRTPFTGDTMMARLVARVMETAPRLSDFCPDAPTALVDAVAKALAMRAEDRFANAAEFAAALARVEVQAKKSAPASTVEMTAVPVVEGSAETIGRTPDTIVPAYDEFQKALADKAQQSGDSQQFTLPSWVKRHRYWVAAAVALLLLVVFTVVANRGGSRTRRTTESEETAKAPSPLDRLAGEATALAERPNPARIQKLWKEIWSLTDSKNSDEVRQAAHSLSATAPHPLDATFNDGEIQRAVCKPGFFESLAGGDQVRRLALSPDGRTAASLSEHGVTLHDLIANASDTISTEDRSSPTCLAFHPSGETLAVGTHEGAVHLFEMTGRTKTQTLPGRGLTSNVGFLSDGTGLVATHAPKQAVYWRFDSKRVGRNSFDLPHAPSTLAFLPYSTSILVGGLDGRTTVLDLKTGVKETNARYKSTIAGTEYTPDGKHVLVLAWESACWRIDGSNYSQVWNIPANPKAKWVGSWSSPWVERLVTLASNGRLQLRSWKTGEVAWEHDVLTGLRQAAALAVTPDGRFAAVQARDGGIELVKLPAIK